MADILRIYFHIKAKLEKSSESFMYHGWLHTKTFFDVVCYLGVLENIEECAFERLKIAALFHDTGYTILGDLKKHEYRSTVITRKELPLFGVHVLDIEEICSLIMTTVPGHTPIDIVEDVMIDADYEYLGRDYYPYVAELLRRELGISQSIWREQQKTFFENHEFRTASARELFDNQKEINYRRLLKEIEDNK